MEDQVRIPNNEGSPRSPLHQHRAPATHTDAELVALVHSRGLGWKLAFNELLGRHRGWLVRHCEYRLGNRHDAQDVAQQVLVRAWQAIDRFQGRSALRTWLYTIAENQCRTCAVKRYRYLQSEHIERLIELHLEHGTCGIAEQHARSQAVAAVLERLGDKAREVLLLRFFQDCSLEEVAATLSISLSATKMRLYRAMAQFRQEYLRLTDIHTAGALNPWIQGGRASV